MKNRTRNILFYFALVFFVVLAPGLTLYSLGYRFDWQAKAVRKVGMIIIEAQPKEARVYINNKFAGKESPVKVKNLLPGTYHIRVEQDGYFSWEKRLAVKSQEVNWASHVILIKKELSEEIAQESATKSFDISPDDEMLAYTSNNENEKGLWIKKIKNTLLPTKNGDTNTEERIFPNDADAFAKNNNLKNVNFVGTNFSDDKNILFSWTTRGGSLQYGLINIEKKDVLYLSDLFGPNISDIQVQNNDIYFLDNASLKKTDFLAKKADTLQSDVFDYAPSKNNLYYFKKSNGAISLRKTANSSSEIGQIEKTDGVELKVSSLGYLAYYDQKNNKLFVNTNKNQKEISKEKINDFIWSKGGDKLLFYSDFEIWLYYANADEKLIHPEYPANIAELITRISKNIDLVEFFDDEHGLYLSAGHLNFFEFDNRDRRNINETNLKILKAGLPHIVGNTIYYIRETDKKIAAAKID